MLGTNSPGSRKGWRFMVHKRSELPAQQATEVANTEVKAKELLVKIVVLPLASGCPLLIHHTDGIV